MGYQRCPGERANLVRRFPGQSEKIRPEQGEWLIQTRIENFGRGLLSRQADCQFGTGLAVRPSDAEAPAAESLPSIQEIRPIQRIPLHRLKPRVADDAAQLLFCGAVGHAGGADYVFFQHYGSDVVAAEAQA
jgi:hypothetical protein